ncbi:MAG TPA: hypothetical protein VGB45_12970 [Abditibacterium sp.]
MKNTFKVALAALALAGISQSARADLTINGEVGLPLNPTAQIPQEGGARIQGNYFDLGGNADLYGIAAAARVGTTLEVNGGINRFKFGGGSETGFNLGAKYLFAREGDAEGVRLAVGAGLTEVDNGDNQRIYAVATKYLGALSGEKVPVTAHLGLRYDRFKVIDSNKASIFAGVEVPLTSTGDVQVVGEIGSKSIDGGRVPYSASVRYRAKAQPFGASIGVSRSSFSGGSSPKLFAQLGYTFGSK